jgi:hypothetical protein
MTGGCIYLPNLPDTLQDRSYSYTSLHIGQYIAPRILHLAPRIPDIVAHNYFLVPCPLNIKSSIWLVLPDSIDKTQSF